MSAGGGNRSQIRALLDVRSPGCCPAYTLCLTAVGGPPYHVQAQQQFVMAIPRLNLRERDVLETVHRLGRASAEDVRAAMPDPPTNSAVRAHLRTLEEKGHLQHEKEGRKFVYAPAVRPGAARRDAVRHLLRTFFADAPETAFATLLSETASDLSPEKLDQLDALIQDARREAT